MQGTVVHFWDEMVFFWGTFLPIVYGDWAFSRLGFQKKEKDSRTFVGLLFTNNNYLKQI
jgi:hypothetical protein